MAEEEVQLADVAEEKKSSALKWIIIGVVSVVLLSGGIVGALFALGVVGTPPAQASSDPADVAEVKKAAVYVSIQPAFTVNFSGDSRARFLQVSVDVMTRNPSMEEQLKLHMPVIRNNLVMLFSSKDSTELSSPEGKAALQSEALASIQSVLEEETGDKGVEAVYFTSFVMQ